MSKKDYVKYITRMLEKTNSLEVLELIYKFVQTLFVED